MATIHELLAQVQDEALRAKLEEEVKKLSKQKKFGLVFEEHLPECTPLYGLKIRRGTTVARKEKINDTLTVLKVEGDVAVCKHRKGEDLEEIPLAELVPVAEFGEPIYPYLQPIDSVCNAPDSDLWHTLIEADNYHALQLLEYLYAGKVDCIYIDPPYNTGAKDWKYNNDYVDGSDSYRHSKWLSMMQKRLKIAKKLLNPTDSVLIVTIDEKEYLHLGCLLEEMFPDARTQMISSIISQKGVARNSSFYRTNEFIFFIQIGKSAVLPLPLSEEWILGKKSQLNKTGVAWASLRRGSTNYLRADRPNLFYPIIMDKDAKRIIDVGAPLLDMNIHPDSPLEDKGDVVWLWPIRQDGVECNWNLSPSKTLSCAKKGYIKIGARHENSLFLSYLKQGSINKIESGEVEVVGYEEQSGTVIVDSSDYVRNFVPGSQWNIASHDASYLGSQLINKIFISKRFDYPKSLYAVHDTIRFFVANKPNALIIDFFAGSGTTMHAVNLLNAEDGGHRRCIMVTNNEVSDPQFLYEGYEQGIFREIRNSIKIEKVVGRKKFNDKINEINESNKKLAAVSKNLADSISYFIDNPNDIETFIKKCQDAQSFSSRILFGDIIFLNDAFAFNCIINKVEVRDLSNQEADDLVKEHQREDGQYVFEGTFIPQEEIKKIISKRFMVIRIEFSYKVSPETGIIQLSPYDKE